MGLLTITLGKALGAAPIIAVGHGGRSGLAAQFGADLTLDALESGWQKAIWDVTHGTGADVVMVTASSSKAQHDAIALAAALGRVNFFAGLPDDDGLHDFPSNVLHYRQVSVLGTTGSTRSDIEEVIRLMETGRLATASNVVTHVMGLREFMSAVTAMDQRNGLKCMLSVD
jgi:L-iditol 2-dehydrogenase